MATFRIITATKKASDTVDTVEALLAEAYPDWRVENLVEENGEWKARIVQAAEPPAFLKEKKDESSDSAESDDSSDSESDESGDESEDESDSEDEGDSKGKSDKKKGDPVAEVKKIMDELQGLLSDLGGKTQELQDAHQEKADKLKDISDTVGDDGGMPAPDGPPRGLGPDAEMSPDEIGPTPKAGPIPPVPKRPGVPSGGAPVPGRPSAFSGRKRNTEIATHPGVDREGKRISLTAAMAELEADPQFKDYVVVQTREENGRYVAKLKLRN